MATLTAPTGGAGYGPRITELAPKGTYLATIVDISDRFGVERPKFEDPTQTEKVDLTIFTFGFKAKDGKLYLVKTRDMKISGNEKSTLYAFLMNLTGEPPRYGWDYCELIGSGAQITVAHRESKRTPGKVYATLGSVAPVMEEVKAKVLPVDAFAGLLEGNAPAASPGKPAAAPADDEDGDMPF